MFLPCILMIKDATGGRFIADQVIKSMDSWKRGAGGGLPPEEEIAW